MTAAILLARQGRRVLVVERQPAPLPLVRRHLHQGLWCENGFHYLGGYVEGAGIQALFRALGAHLGSQCLPMSREAFDKCLTNQTIIDGLTEVKQRGRQFGVIGTPTFFINGRKAQGEVTFDEIKALIEQAPPPPAPS